MIRRDQLIAIGHYNKPHGVAGEIAATLSVDCDMLASLSCLVSDIDGIYVPFFVNSCRPKSATTVLLTIDGIADQRQATTLVGRDIFALADECRPDDDDEDPDEQYYPLEGLIGLELLSDDGTRVGEIADIDDSTDNVLLLVDDGSGNSLMIPACDDWVVDLNPEAGTITMNLPNGILDLNLE